MEAMGFLEWIYDLLEAMGFEVVLAHPAKVRAIAELCRLAYREWWVLAWRATVTLVPCPIRGLRGNR